jgi:hypothetical protein
MASDVPRKDVELTEPGPGQQLLGPLPPAALLAAAVTQAADPAGNTQEAGVETPPVEVATPAADPVASKDPPADRPLSPGPCAQAGAPEQDPGPNAPSPKSDGNPTGDRPACNMDFHSLASQLVHPVPNAAPSCSLVSQELGRAPAQESARKLAYSQALPFTIPLPMIKVVRHFNKGMQMHLLHTILKLPVENPHEEHTPVCSIDDLTTAEQRNLPDTPQMLALRTVAVAPKKEVELKLSQRERIYNFMSDPASSTGARILSVIIMLCIGSTTVAYCYESMPGIPETKQMQKALDGIETVSTMVFTAEYLIRLLTCASRRKFLVSVLNFVDLLAIVPFYVEIVLDMALSSVPHLIACTERCVSHRRQA